MQLILALGPYFWICSKSCRAANPQVLCHIYFASSRTESGVRRSRPASSPSAHRMLHAAGIQRSSTPAQSFTRRYLSTAVHTWIGKQSTWRTQMPDILYKLSLLRSAYCTLVIFLSFQADITACCQLSCKYGANKTAVPQTFP